jgi:ABC-2 type transport system permease protein
LVDLPFRVYTGHIAAADLTGVLARQLLWTVVLVVFGRSLLARGMRKIVAQGG